MKLAIQKYLQRGKHYDSLGFEDNTSMDVSALQLATTQGKVPAAPCRWCGGPHYDASCVKGKGKRGVAGAGGGGSGKSPGPCWYCGQAHWSKMCTKGKGKGGVASAPMKAKGKGGVA
eukprot:10873519-Heterocapsa_arctica.AAC.1